MRQKFPAFIIGVSVLLCAGFALFFLADTPLLQSDSAGYINFSPTRTILYPAFLWSINALFGTLKAVPYIQLTVFSLCVFFLSLTLYQWRRSLILSLGLIVGIMLNVEVIKYCFIILTEALTFSLVMLCLVFLTRLVRSRKQWDALGLVICVALSLLLRPASYAFLILPVLAGLLCYTKVKKAKIVWASVLMAPIVLAFLSGALVNQVRHGFFSPQSFLGYTLLGKTGMLADEDLTPDPIIKAMTDRTAAVRQLRREMPNLRERYLITAAYYDSLRRLFGNVLKDVAEEAGQNPSDLAKDVSYTLIRQRPYAYIQDVAMNFWALWSLADLMTHREAQNFNRHREAHQDIKLYTPYPYHPNGRHPVIVYGVRAVISLAFLAGFGAILLLGVRLYRRQTVSDLHMTIAVSALFAHAAYLLIAGVQAGIPRFAFSMWAVHVWVDILVVSCVNIQNIPIFLRLFRLRYLAGTKNLSKTPKQNP